VTLCFRAADLPLLPGARDLALTHRPGGLGANQRQFEPQVAYPEGAPDDALRALLYDPQTSGGLLLAVPEENAEALLRDLTQARAVGKTEPRGERPLVVR
jgi:selenide,water dikinase